MGWAFALLLEAGPSEAMTDRLWAELFGSQGAARSTSRNRGFDRSAELHPRSESGVTSPNGGTNPDSPAGYPSERWI